MSTCMQLPQNIHPRMFLDGTADGQCSFLAEQAPSFHQTQGSGELLIIHNS